MSHLFVIIMQVKAVIYVNSISSKGPLRFWSNRQGISRSGSSRRLPILIRPRFDPTCHHCDPHAGGWPQCNSTGHCQPGHHSNCPYPWPKRCPTDPASRSSLIHHTFDLFYNFLQFENHIRSTQSVKSRYTLFWIPQKHTTAAKSGCLSWVFGWL